MNESKLTKEALTAFAAKNRDRFESLLKDFVERPTVSVDPSKKPAIAECVTLACDTIKAFGGVPEVLQTAGHPHRPRRLRRTIPPARRSPSTTTSTSSPRRRRRSRGRRSPSSSRRRATATSAAARRTTRAPRSRRSSARRPPMDAGVPVNVRVLWEFEEEIGSPSFAKGIAAREGQARDGLDHRLRHDLDRARQAGRAGRACAACRACSSRSRRARRTSTRASRAARRATRWPSSCRSSPSASTRRRAR